jgi:hypothetical protein
MGSPGWRQTHKGRNSGGLWWNSGGLHGVGSTDLHGVAELNCTNKLHYGWQNQTVQISKTILFTGWDLRIYTGWQNQTVQISYTTGGRTKLYK